MNKYQRGAEVLKNEINRINDLTALSDVLDEIGSMQQAVAEYEGRIGTLRVAEEAAQKRIADAERFEKETIQNANAIKKQADADAERIVAEATEKAAALAAAAQRDLDAFEADAKARVRAIEADIAAANAARDAARTDAAAAESSLADVQRKSKALAASLAQTGQGD